MRTSVTCVFSDTQKCHWVLQFWSYFSHVLLQKMSLFHLTYNDVILYSLMTTLAVNMSTAAIGKYSLLPVFNF